jgi:DNA-directed RNA polymerase specialized sigma subunit
MLTDKEVLPTVYYWASKFKSRKFEYAELLSVGYAAAKELENVLLLQKTVKYAILKYICSDKKIERSLDTSDEHLLDVKLVEQANRCELIEDLDAAIKESDLDARTLLVMKLYFFEEYNTFEKVSNCLGDITPQGVHYKMTQALNKIKKALLKRHTNFRKDLYATL